MGLDPASLETPRLVNLEGGPIGFLLAGPPLIKRPWRRAMARIRTGRLPGMVAIFSDGRRFAINAGDLMYEQVYRLGEYEPVVTRTVRALLREGDTAVDVGANHGWYSLVMANAVGPTGTVHAIEPVPPLIQALRANLARNPNLEVHVHPVAVGADEGDLELHVFPDLPHGHASAATLGRSSYHTHRAPLRRLASLLAGARPVLIKVDVEGFEPEVLTGAQGLLGTDEEPMWLIEVNYETAAAFDRCPAAAPDVLSESDYALYRVEDEGLFPDEHPAEAPDGTTWLCVPRAHADRAEPLVRKQRAKGSRGKGLRRHPYAAGP
jgi:FkbM family methyltransferase